MTIAAFLQSQAQTPPQVEETVLKVNQAAVDVFLSLGSGASELIYHQALAYSLTALGCKVESKVTVPCHFREQYVGCMELDLLVNQCLIVEVKAVARNVDINSHLNQLRQYMFQTSTANGVVVNFPQKSNVPLGLTLLHRVGAVTTAALGHLPNGRQWLYYHVDQAHTITADVIEEWSTQVSTAAVPAKRSRSKSPLTIL